MSSKDRFLVTSFLHRVYKTQPGLALTNSLTVQRFSFRTYEISDRKDSRWNNVRAYLARYRVIVGPWRVCASRFLDAVTRREKKGARNDNRRGGEEKIRQFAILTSVLNIVAALFPAESTTVVKRTLLPDGRKERTKPRFNISAQLRQSV